MVSNIYQPTFVGKGLGGGGGKEEIRRGWEGVKENGACLFAIKATRSVINFETVPFFNSFPFSPSMLNFSKRE